MSRRNLAGTRSWRKVCAAGAVLLCAATAGARSGDVVEIWVRGAGAYGVGADPARQRVESLVLTAVPNQVIESADIQYDATYEYWGVPVAQLLAIYSPPPAVDLALLRFANGTVVPLPFREPKVMARLAPFVARAMRVHGEQHFRVGQFFPMSKKQERYADVRPLAFGANKMVVRERWLPGVPVASLAFFSPWSQVDTLVGIELVQAAAYRRQVDVEPEAHAGAALFWQSCGFCHAVRGVGGALGWDFVEPVAIYSDEWQRRFGRGDAPAVDGERNFYYHVRYRAQVTPGRAMPGLRFTSEEDAQAIWQWIAAAARHPLGPYRP